MTQFRSPKYLNERKDEPVRKVRCPVHGFIHYSSNEQAIIDHPWFRRLRHIRQLALTEYVYPGATHSRFEHSLGVMEVATRAFDSLASRHGERMEAKFAELPEFKDATMAKARQSVRLAALLHDIGHAPFSHVAEKQIEKVLGVGWRVPRAFAGWMGGSRVAWPALGVGRWTRGLQAPCARCRIIE